MTPSHRLLHTEPSRPTQNTSRCSPVRATADDVSVRTGIPSTGMRCSYVWVKKQIGT